MGPNFIDFGGPISRSAEGTYTVQSTSDAGTVNSTFQLEVIRKIKNPSVVNISEIGEWLSLKRVSL